MNRLVTCGDSTESQEEEAFRQFLLFRLLPQLFIFTHAVLVYGGSERCKARP